MTVYPTGAQPVVLGDDTIGAHITADLPSQQRSVQPAPRYRAPFQKLFGRGNRLNSFSFQTERAHANYAEAAKFKWDHPDAVPIQGTVEVVQDGVSRWLDEAVIPEVRCTKHTGVTTIFSYTVQGGAFLSANPNT